MTDVASIQKDTSPFLEDDLEPVTEQQLEMLYGLLDPSDRPSSFVRKRNTEKERTFIERFSSDEDRRKSLFVDVDFEMHRQSHDQVFEQYQTPRKSSPVGNAIIRTAKEVFLQKNRSNPHLTSLKFLCMDGYRFFLMRNEERVWRMKWKKREVMQL